MKRLAFLTSTCALLALSACMEAEQAPCHEGLSGSMFRSTALKEFPVCGEFTLQPDPNVTAQFNGLTRIIGKKYAFENTGEPFESVYYIKGELIIYRKDSTDFDASAFDFSYEQLAIPQGNTFENDEVVVTLKFAHDKSNPSHQGPVQYVEWIGWQMRFEKGPSTDKIKGQFNTENGTFWIPGPASNSYASLDLRFEIQ